MEKYRYTTSLVSTVEEIDNNVVIDHSQVSEEDADKILHHTSDSADSNDILSYVTNDESTHPPTHRSSFSVPAAQRKMTAVLVCPRVFLGALLLPLQAHPFVVLRQKVHSPVFSPFYRLLQE